MKFWLEKPGLYQLQAGRFVSALQRGQNLFDRQRVRCMSKELLLENGRDSWRRAWFPQALRDFNAAVELDQDCADAWYGMAEAHEGLGHYPEAIEAYQKARALDPAGRGTIATCAIGNCQRQLGEREAALRSYEAALASNPALDRIWQNHARLNFELGRYEEARAGFARLAELQPGRAAGWIWQGYCLQLLGRDEAAKGCYDRAGNDVDVAEVWMVVGADELQRGRWNEALNAYDRAIGLKPDWGGAHSVRAACLTELGRSGEAIAAFQRAAALDQRLALSSLVNQAALHIRAGQRKAASEFYARAAVIKPRSALDHVARGEALGALGRFDEALASFAQARRLEPTRHDFMFYEAGCLESAGRLDEATAAFEALLTQAPSYFQAWRKLARCLVKCGAYQRAIEWCEKARNLGADSADLAHVHGLALFATGRPKDAIPRFEAVVAADDTSGNAWMYLARSHLGLEQPEAALTCFDRVLALNPTSEDAWSGRGLAQETLGLADPAESSKKTSYALHLMAQVAAPSREGSAMYLYGRTARP
jgi:protein O-GlcNAc transferase